MKKTNLKVMDNTANTKQAIKKETEQRYDGKAIAFIKSRKAEHKIHKMAEEMYKTAELAGVELVDVIVDDSANDDIDRREITDFCKTVDDTDALVVLVNNLFAFTTDLDDLLKFVETLMYKPVMILEMEHHHILSLDYSDDSEVDEYLGRLRFTDVEFGTIVRYGDGSIAGVFPTEQEAYEYFGLDDLEDEKNDGI